MWEDPIVAEVRKTREQILAKFDYDLGAYFEHLKSVGAENRARGVKYVQPAPRNIPGAKPDAA
jgi:hypothetical protein